MGCFIFYDNSLSNFLFTFLVNFLLDDYHVVQLILLCVSSLLEPKLHGFYVMRSLMFNLFLNYFLVIIYSSYYFDSLHGFVYLHIHNLVYPMSCISYVKFLLCRINKHPVHPRMILFSYSYFYVSLAIDCKLPTISPVSQSSCIFWRVSTFKSLISIFKSPLEV